MCHRDVKSGLVGDLLELSYYGKEDPAAVIVELDLDLHALPLAHEADHGAHAELLVPDAVPRAERRDLLRFSRKRLLSVWSVTPVFGLSGGMSPLPTDLESTPPRSVRMILMHDGSISRMNMLGSPLCCMPPYRERLAAQER